MKKIYLIVFALIISFFAKANKIEPFVSVDKRIELLSIVARLANYEEYKTNQFKSYANDVDIYFSKYKNHKLISYFKEIRRKNGIAYDAVISYAIRIEFSDNNLIKLFDVENIGIRWDNENIRKTTELLNDFYKVSNFESFFANNSKIYRVAEKNMNEAISQIDYNWFNNFYGNVSTEKYNIVPAMLIGYSNYGGRTVKDKDKILYSIIGTSTVDKNDNPIYLPKSVESLVIHEFTHSFMNPLVDVNFSLFENQIKDLYKLSKRTFKLQAYDDIYPVAYESFVRAGVIQYYIDKRETDLQIKIRIRRENLNGFYLTSSLLNSFKKLRRNKMLVEYIPELIENFNSENPKQLKQDFKKLKKERCWVVSSTIENRNMNVDSSIDSVTLTFNTSLDLWCRGIGHKNDTKEVFDSSRSGYFNTETGLEYTQPIKLEPNKEYTISFFSFKSSSGGKMKGKYKLNFTTGGKSKKD